MTWSGLKLTAQMNADPLTEDLKKKRASNQSFWLVEWPDVEMCEITEGDHKGKWEAEVSGFDCSLLFSFANLGLDHQKLLKSMARTVMSSCCP
jgi:hypothetical protein